MPNHLIGPASVSTSAQRLSSTWRVRARRCAVAALCLLTCTAVMADPASKDLIPNDPGPAIQQTARAFLDQEAALRAAPIGGEARVTLTSAESRPRLAPCTAMEAFLPAGVRLPGRALVGVRCLAGATWQVYVSAELRITAPMWVTARTIAAGQAIAAADIVLAARDLTPDDMADTARRGNGHLLAAMASPEGQQALRPLVPGIALRWDDLRDEDRLNPGDSVKVVYSGDGFSVATDGRAIGGASPGQTVQIRLGGGKIIVGVLGAAHTVEAAL